MQQHQPNNLQLRNFLFYNFHKKCRTMYRNIIFVVTVTTKLDAKVLESLSCLILSHSLSTNMSFDEVLDLDFVN